MITTRDLRDTKEIRENSINRMIKTRKILPFLFPLFKRSPFYLLLVFSVFSC